MNICTSIQVPGTVQFQGSIQQATYQNCNSSRLLQHTFYLVTYNIMSSCDSVEPNDAHGKPSDGMMCLCTMEDITEEDQNYGACLCVLDVLGVLGELVSCRVVSCRVVSCELCSVRLVLHMSDSVDRGGVCLFIACTLVHVHTVLYPRCFSLANYVIPFCCRYLNCTPSTSYISSIYLLMHMYMYMYIYVLLLLLLQLIVEYQSHPSGIWKPALFEASIVEELLETQFHQYISRVKTTDCQAELKRLLAAGPPIYLQDKHAMALATQDDTHIRAVWFARDNRHVSAKLQGAVEGDERMALWEELKQFIVVEGKEEGDDDDDVDEEADRK